MHVADGSKSILVTILHFVSIGIETVILVPLHPRLEMEYSKPFCLNIISQ